MIKLKVISPEESIFNGECAKIQMKTAAGVVTILPKHTPLVTVIKDGYIIIDDQEQINIKSALVAVNEKSIVDIVVSQF